MGTRRGALWSEGDGKFRVAIYYRAARDSFRVVAGFVGDRQAEETHGGREVAIEAALRIWHAYESGVIEAADSPPVTVGELAERVENKPGLRPATRATYRKAWRLLAQAVGAETVAARVKRRDVEAFLSAYSDRPVNAASFLRNLRAGWRWAVAQGWVAQDPTAGISVSVARAMGSWLPFGEWPALLAACSEGHRVRAGFVLETGLRAGEVAAARWSWVQGEVGRRAIVVAPDATTGFVPKWGTARAAPLTARAEEWLAAAGAKWGREGFIFSADGLSEPNFARDTAIAVTRAGVTKVTFHGLRRSAGAHWLDCGVSLLHVSRLLGHSTTRVTEQWYAGVADASLAGAMGLVEEAEARSGQLSGHAQNGNARLRVVSATGRHR